MTMRLLLVMGTLAMFCITPGCSDDDDNDDAGDADADADADSAGRATAAA